jgi:hypothetical protein
MSKMLFKHTFTLDNALTYINKYKLPLLMCLSLFYKPALIIYSINNTFDALHLSSRHVSHIFDCQIIETGLW